jgi:hypothetical protein
MVGNIQSPHRHPERRALQAPRDIEEEVRKPLVGELLSQVGGQVLGLLQLFGRQLKKVDVFAWTRSAPCRYGDNRCGDHSLC